MDTTPTTCNVDTSKISQITNFLKVKANPWVKVVQRPSSYSFDKALLLYRISSNEWMAWIPDFGQTRLNEMQFYYLD